MPPADGAPTGLPWRCGLLLAALTAAGFALTLYIFYPGVMTYDARFVYEDIAKNTLGDWQSPAMTVLWAWIDPLAPGPASMFLLMATMYWLAFGLLAVTFAHRSIGLAVILLLLALSPPAFVFQGIIWRDVLFANSWLLAAALSFAAAERGARLRLSAEFLALGLLALGVLLRPNALVAAPLLAAAILWPRRLSFKRTAIAYAPIGFALFGLVQFIYYGALGATRQHPLQSIMVFDLGGISHFARQNQFPVVWSEAETKQLLNTCYRPTQWDIYWRIEPCEFVMRKLEGEEKLFGTPAVTTAWVSAIAHHPVAYLEHRAAFMWNFLARENLTMWTDDVYDPSKKVFADRPAFNALVAVHDALRSSPLFRAGTWLVLCAAVCAFAWRRRDTAVGQLGQDGTLFTLRPPPAPGGEWLDTVLPFQGAPDDGALPVGASSLARMACCMA
ncbi:MAG: hypothetical protein ACREB8_16065, partial [Pseudolabrys sp.]